VIEDAYAPVWESMLRRRKWMGIAPAPGCAGALLCVHGRAWSIVLGVSLLLIGLAMGAYGTPGKCPRCGKRFDGWWFFQSSYTKKCLHCGIRIGTPQEMI
jgi:hypothetical protein